jgi:hypothetical protein
MAVLRTILYLLVYPGILFLFVYSTFAEWFDRKVYARLQNRMGPTHTGRWGLLQPIADFVKLMSKEDIVPERADKRLYTPADLRAGHRLHGRPASSRLELRPRGSGLHVVPRRRHHPPLPPEPADTDLLPGRLVLDELFLDDRRDPRLDDAFWI